MNARVHNGNNGWINALTDELFIIIISININIIIIIIMMNCWINAPKDGQRGQSIQDTKTFIRIRRKEFTNGSENERTNEWTNERMDCNSGIN